MMMRNSGQRAREAWHGGGRLRRRPAFGRNLLFSPSFVRPQTPKFCPARQSFGASGRAQVNAPVGVSKLKYGALRAKLMPCHLLILFGLQ